MINRNYLGPKPVVQILLLLLLCVGAVLAGPAAAQFNNADLFSTEQPSTCRVGLRVYESERGKILLGELYQEDFSKLLPDWDTEFAGYQPIEQQIDLLSAVDQHIDIICVLGTWCHDSEREVPRFWKILKQAGNPSLELTMFAVGRSSDPHADEILTEIGFDENLRERYGVKLVPTFIVFIDGWEVGRIVETPATTLEEDLVKLIVAEDKDAESSWH